MHRGVGVLGWVAFALGAAACPECVCAQGTAASTARVSVLRPPGSGDNATLAGIVRFAGDSGGVYGVEISLLGTVLSAHTDTTGRFAIPNIPPGHHDVIARRFGFLPASAEVEMAAGAEYSLAVTLQQLPVALARVTIRGQTRFVPPYLEDAYRRGATGMGTFLTAEDIDRMHPMDVYTVIGNTPGAHVSQGGITFARCGYGAELGIYNRGAKIQIYIDGTRLTDGSQASIALALRTIHVSQVQAIEVYRGVAEIPAEFLEDACAVIAIWTKRGGR